MEFDHKLATLVKIEFGIAQKKEMHTLAGERKKCQKELETKAQRGAEFIVIQTEEQENIWGLWK